MTLSFRIPTMTPGPRLPSLIIVHFNHYQNFSGKDTALLDFGENLEQLLQECSRLTDPRKTIGLHLQSPELEPFTTGIITSQRAWDMFVNTLAASSSEIGSTSPSFIAAVQPADSEIEERTIMHLGLLGRQGSESMPSESISSFSVAQPGTPSFSPTPSLSPPLTSPPIVSASPAPPPSAATTTAVQAASLVSATGVPKLQGDKPTITWRQRLAEKEKQVAMSSPATTNAPLPETKKDAEGKAWRPRRLQN